MKPRILTEGSTIGITASSSPFLKERFEKGVHVLEGLGFRVKFSKKIFRKKGYLAGSDKERAQELNRLFADPHVDAIMFARGGYGIQRILPLLKLNLLKKFPKVIVGYSDITALIGYLTSRMGVPCIHGPVVTGLTAVDDETSRSLKKALIAKGPLWAVKNPSWKVLKEGRASGKFVGGCLTLAATALGTPFAIDPKDSILFFEDTNERIYRYDRLLTQLKNAGFFKKARGIVFGPMGVAEKDKNPSLLWPVIAEILSDFKGPVVAGLPSGHTVPFYSIPLGVRSSLTALRAKGRTQLVFEESVYRYISKK